MALSKAQINRLIEAVKKHVNWLVYALGGSAALTPEEIKALKDDKSLPSGVNVDLVENGHVLGMLRMLLKKSEFQNLSFEELQAVVESGRTPVEDLAVHQALHTAGVHIKRLGQDIADGAYDAILGAGVQTLNEAAVKDLVKDEIAFALLKRKNYMSVASDLAHNMKTDWRRDWRRVAETELHRAKVQGQVQAILNKVDVYAYGEGPDSRVSVVPAPDRCSDCHHHYLDSNGVPKIFKLSDLLAAGSNGDEGVSHKRANGRHIHWKTTLPPLHPRCGCNLVYVPPGYSWVDGHLRLTDEEAYKASLVKKSVISKGNGTEVNKDSGKTYKPFKAQATPLGAPAQQNKAQAAPPSIPGVDSPAKAVVGGNATRSGTSATVKAPAGAQSITPSQQSEVKDCPLGAQRCQQLGGTGHHHTDSQMYAEHQQIAMQSMAALGQGGQPGQDAQAQTPAQSQEDLAQTLAVAATWKHEATPTQKTIEHLSVGEVGHVLPLSGTMSHGVAKLTIKGNGSGCFKPERAGQLSGAEALKNASFNEVVGYITENTGHKREVAGYSHAASYGSSLVPVTTYRNHDGQEGSIQAWINDSKGLDELHNDLSDETVASYSHGKGESMRGMFNPVKYMIETSKNPAKTQERFCEAIVQDLMINNTDAHNGNFRVSDSDQGKTFHAIDKGLAFGKGFHGVRNIPMGQMKKAGYKVTIPAHLEKQMRARSLSDELRSVGGHVSKREAAETFLRTKYLLHLQDTEGHLDYKHFINLQPSINDPFLKEHKAGDDLPMGVWDKWHFGDSDSIKEDLKKNGTPQQRFERFVDSYMKDVEANPSHPDRKDFEGLKEALGSDAAVESPIERHIREQQQEHQAKNAQRVQMMQEYHAELKRQMADRLRSGTVPAAGGTARPKGLGTVPATPGNRTAPATPGNKTAPATPEANRTAPARRRR